MALLLRSFKCDCGKNSQFAIIRLLHLKSVLRYIGAVTRRGGVIIHGAIGSQSRSKLLGNGQANFNKLTLTSINYFRVTFEPVTFARCAFIIALRNIALDGYLDTRRNI